MGLITLAKNFCHWTFSVVIAGHLAKTNNKIWRAFWSILLIITIIAFCLHCALNVIEYLAYEKTTVIRLYSLPSAPFPAVTICNLNPFKKSALDKSSSLSNLISAYKYTLDKKATTESTAIITTSPTEKKLRRKRETCPTDGVSSVKAPSSSIFETYTVSNCDGTYFDLMYNMCDGSSEWFFDHMLITDFNENKDIIEKGFFYCAHDTICANNCSAWVSGNLALKSIADCAKKNFTYPPVTGEFNIAAMIAKTYAQNCALSDKNCDFGYYKKPSIKYPANYWYVACPSATPDVNNVTIKMEGCDGVGGVPFNRKTTALINPPTTCLGNYQTISNQFSNALDETDCGVCGINCPYTSTTNDCDTNQQLICSLYQTSCPKTTTEESLITSTQEKTTIMIESTTDQGLPMSTTVPIQSTTIDGSGSITTTSIGLHSSTPIPVQSTTVDPSFSTTNGASTTEAIAFTTLKPSTTPDFDTTTNILTTTPLVTRTFEPSSSSNELITTSALFTTKLSTILSTSKEITTIAPTSTEIITPSTVLPSSTDSSASIISSTMPSLETTTAIEKTSTDQTTNAAIISSTILSTPSNLPTTTNAITVTTTNPNTAESTVRITITPIVTIPLTSKASPTTEILSTTPVVTITNEPPSVSSTNIKTTSFLTTADNSGFSTSKISTTLAVSTIKSSTSQTQQVSSSSKASTNDLLNTSPTSVVAITASSKSETSGILSTSNPFITTVLSKDTTSVTKNSEMDSTTPSSLGETTPSTKNDGSDSQTSTKILTTQKQNSLSVTSKVVTNSETTPTQNSDLDSQTTTNFLTTQTQSSLPVTSNAITLPSTKTLDPSMTSSSNAIVESSSSTLPNKASQTTMESDVTQNVFPSSLSYANSLTTNIIDPNYSGVTSSTVNDDIFPSRKTSSFPITLLLTSNKGITNNLGTTKATAITSSFNTTQGTLSSTTLDTISMNSSPKSLISTSDTITMNNLSPTTGSGSNASNNESNTALSSDNIVSYTTTPSTNTITNISKKTNNETQITTPINSSSNPLLFTSIISTTSPSLSDPLNAGNNNSLFTSSNPTMENGSNQSTINPTVNSNLTSSSNPFQTTLSIPSPNNSDTTTQSSTNNVIKSLTDSYGNLITEYPSNSNNSDSNNSNSNNSNSTNSNNSNKPDNTNSNNSNSNNTNSDSNDSNSNNSNSDISGGDTNQFNLSSLSSPLSTTDLEALSRIYNLNSSQDTITIETNAQNSLIAIAASLTDAEKEALGYKLPELIQTCVIDGVLCNVERDFSQIYDVDYGYCYTFNQELLYNTTRMGTDHGLKLVVLSDANEYLATSSEQGVKVVVHYQEQSPFPNIDGYRSGTGKAIDLRVTYGIVSRLDAPYGECNDLDKLKELNQPFYYTGTYTVEGCYRSCFQQKLSMACNCSDSRFPLPTDLSTTTFCQNTDTVKYACYEKYIEDNGDYYNVKNCSCAIPCNDITYAADAYYSNWPYGTYFYQALCSNATLLNGSDCRQYYQDNAVLVQVSYAKLGYKSMKETPVTSGSRLFNNLAGNTGLWIGFTAVTAAELALIFIQISLWIFTKKAELKEVPSCRRRNYTFEGDLDKQKDDVYKASKAAIIGGISGGTDAVAAGITRNNKNNPFQKSFFSNIGFNHKPKNFANNDLRKRRNSYAATLVVVADPSSLYESIIPVNHVDVYESQLVVAPTPVQSAINESVPKL